MIIYVQFILFEGFGKNIPFNSILDFAILSDFKMRTVIICRGWGWESRGGTVIICVVGVGWGGEGASRLVSSQLKAPPPHTHTHRPQAIF